jgi:predicted permease
VQPVPLETVTVYVPDATDIAAVLAPFDQAYVRVPEPPLVADAVMVPLVLQPAGVVIWVLATRLPIDPCTVAVAVAIQPLLSVTLMV